MAEPTHEHVNALGHEPIETDVRAVWKTGVVIFAVVAMSFALIFGMIRWFSASEPGRTRGQGPKTDPNFAKVLPLRQLRMRETEVLNKYEWVDQQAGVARIPIERAMEIAAEAGVSAPVGRPQAEAPATEEETNEPGNNSTEDSTETQ